MSKEKIASRNSANKEFRFFVHDPNDGTTFYRSVEDRDKAAQEAIDMYLDEGWSEGVDDIIAGEVTHHTVARNVEKRPIREDFDSDEGFIVADEEFDLPSEFTYKCNYELAPLSDLGEETP